MTSQFHYGDYPIGPHHPLGFCWDCNQEQPMVPYGNNFVCIRLGHTNVSVYTEKSMREGGTITLNSITNTPERIKAHNDAVKWYKMSGGQWERDTIRYMAAQQSKRLHAMDKPDFVEAFSLSYLYYKELGV